MYRGMFVHQGSGFFPDSEPGDLKRSGSATLITLKHTYIRYVLCIDLSVVYLSGPCLLMLNYYIFSSVRMLLLNMRLKFQK